MQKIISMILSFLFMIFPFSSTLQWFDQVNRFPGKDVVTEQLIEAFKNEDVEAIREMFCEYEKNDERIVPQIKKLFDAIKGDFVSARYIPAGGSHSNGTESSEEWDIEYVTTKEVYIINPQWFVSDIVNPERVGLYAIFVGNDYRNATEEGREIVVYARAHIPFKTEV